MDTKLIQAVKKEIRKQIKINGSHMGTVRTAIETQFPSIDWYGFIEFAHSEFSKKYDSIKPSIKASIRF